MLGVIERCSRLFLAGVFLIGGIPKLFDLDSFAKVIEAYGLLPEILISPVAVILPVAEVVTGVGLILGRKWSIYSSLGMMLIFMGVLSYGIWIGLDIDCGCFAVTDPEHDAFSGLRHALLRDVVFSVPLLFLLFINSQYYQQIQKRSEK